MQEQQIETTETENVEPRQQKNDLFKEANEYEDELPQCSSATPTPRKKQSLLERQVENQIVFQKTSAKALNDINLIWRTFLKQWKKVKN